MAILLALVKATVEASVGGDWEAVAAAISTRLDDLGMTQKDLAARSGVSVSTIRQLQNNYGPRRRNRHTLEDLSKGLQWSAQHLERILDEATGSPADAGGSLQAEVAELRGLVSELADRVQALEHDRRPASG